MFIDFLTVLMINLSAGTALLAYFVYKGLPSEDNSAYAAGFGVVGLIAFLGGGYMATHWPLPARLPAGFETCRELSERLMTLPCDQRYGRADMERMAGVIREAGAPSRRYSLTRSWAI